MQENIWFKKKIVIYINGSPEKGKSPEATIELSNPQIAIDYTKGIIEIKED